MSNPLWLDWARRLQAFSQRGRLALSIGGDQDSFNREVYGEMQAIAAEMAASASDLTIEEIVGLFETQLGYAAPRVTVRAIVFDGDRVLLVRDVRSGSWTTPGGYAEVNETPSEAVEREVLEESGYAVKAKRLLAVRNLTRVDGEPVRFFSYYALYFDCDLVVKLQEPRPDETSEAPFFPLDALPLTIGLQDRSDEERRARAREHYERLFELHSNPHLPTDFD